MEKKEVSLVTGASSGLGKEIAKLLCKKGFIVYVVARRKEKLLELKKDCSGYSGEIKIIVGDLSDSKFREKFIERIIKDSKKIDYLINNAGFGRAIKLENQDSQEIKNMFEVNVVAYEHLAGLVLKDMKKRNSGRIINIGSVVAFTPLPYFTVYNSTKAAVYNFNRSLRYELKDSRVTSTVVLPARMRTGFAHNAYSCYEKYGKTLCDNFNKIAGSPETVAKSVVRNLNSGKEVVTPTLKSFFWYSTRYVGWIVDLIMKNILGPKELKNIEMEKPEI